MLRARTASLVIGAFVALVGACADEPAPQGPVAIQPQPIPEAGLTTSFVPSAFALKDTATSLEVSGRVESAGPSGLEPAPGIKVSAFDASAAGAVVGGTTDATGAFTIALPKNPGHDVFVFFDADPGGSTSAVLAFRVGQAPKLSPPCLTAAGVRGLDLGSLPALAVRSLPLDLENSCGGDLAVASVRTLGAPLVTTAPAPFTARADRTTRVTFEVRAPAKGPHVGFVVFDDGARRHVLVLQAKGT